MALSNDSSEWTLVTFVYGFLMCITKWPTYNSLGPKVHYSKIKDETVHGKDLHFANYFDKLHNICKKTKLLFSFIKILTSFCAFSLKSYGNIQSFGLVIAENKRNFLKQLSRKLSKIFSQLISLLIVWWNDRDRLIWLHFQSTLH